jgi:UrcA family protein
MPIKNKSAAGLQLNGTLAGIALKTARNHTALPTPNTLLLGGFMNHSTFNRTSVAVALLAAAALLPALANATTNTLQAQAATQTVKFSDLDLNRKADDKVLLHRIRVAAHNVCTINDFMAQQTCYHKAVREAVEQVNRPQLSALL